MVSWKTSSSKLTCGPGRRWSLAGIRHHRQASSCGAIRHQASSGTRGHQAPGIIRHQGSSGARHLQLGLEPLGAVARAVVRVLCLRGLGLRGRPTPACSASKGQRTCAWCQPGPPQLQLGQHCSSLPVGRPLHALMPRRSLELREGLRSTGALAMSLLVPSSCSCLTSGAAQQDLPGGARHQALTRARASPRRPFARQDLPGARWPRWGRRVPLGGTGSGERICTPSASGSTPTRAPCCAPGEGCLWCRGLRSVRGGGGRGLTGLGGCIGSCGSPGLPAPPGIEPAAPQAGQVACRAQPPRARGHVGAPPAPRGRRTRTAGPAAPARAPRRCNRALTGRAHHATRRERHWLRDKSICGGCCSRQLPYPPTPAAGLQQLRPGATSTRRSAPLLAAGDAAKFQARHIVSLNTIEPSQLVGRLGTGHRWWLAACPLPRYAPARRPRQPCARVLGVIEDCRGRAFLHALLRSLSARRLNGRPQFRRPQVRK